MGPNEADMMLGWHEGDPRAFEALVRQWQQPVARILARLVGRTELVQDLCQEVFLRVYRAGPRYQENGAFTSWLYRIALNVARDAGRRGRRQALPLDGHEPADLAASADEACWRREESGFVLQAVAELPEPLRVALVLHHYEGMNFEEISRLTGTPASTIKSRFAAALLRLRTRLQELGLGPGDNEP
jgi:RNA polymerase sigma-70 factor (ECF subfamily)